MKLLDLNDRGKDNIPPGWNLRVKAGTPRVGVLRDGTDLGVCLDSNDSSFSIQRAINTHETSYAVLTWRWRAEVLPPRGDFRNAQTDDQAAQLFVAFGRRAINYIWDTNAPRDVVGDYSLPS